VERSFAWLGRNRRLSKDYEYWVQTSETMIDLTAIRLMLNRIAPGQDFSNILSDHPCAEEAFRARRDGAGSGLIKTVIKSAILKESRTVPGREEQRMKARS
jgi:hypothetical protein